MKTRREEFSLTLYDGGGLAYAHQTTADDSGIFVSDGQREPVHRTSSTNSQLTKCYR